MCFYHIVWVLRVADVPHASACSPLQNQLPAELGPYSMTMNHTELEAAIVVHLDVLYNLAAWLAHDAMEAQDLVHTTCRQALQMMPQTLSGARLRVGLLTILWQMHCQHHAISADGLGEDRTEPANPERRNLFYTLSKADLDAGLRLLPDSLRAVLILTEMEGCAAGEVAEIMRWSQPQVQSALGQARHLLDHFLQARLASSLVFPAPEAQDSL
jgi:DNA-directed RNA polymerase specialized sigma24 family protein